MKVNESNYETLQKASDITLVDYDIKWFDAENIDGYIDSDGLLEMIKDLVVEYNRKEEEVEELKKEIKNMEEDIAENYKPKITDPYDYYGVSRRDFF